MAIVTGTQVSWKFYLRKRVQMLMSDVVSSPSHIPAHLPDGPKAEWIRKTAQTVEFVENETVRSSWPMRIGEHHLCPAEVVLPRQP